MYPENKPNYRIPAIIRAPNNDLLVFAEKRLTSIGDWGSFHIAMKRSTDRGNTWEPEEIIYEGDPGPNNDPTVVVDNDTGRIWLFFLKVKTEFFCMWSGDNGKTWSDPVSIHSDVTEPEWDAFGQGKSGRQRYGVGPGAGAIQLKYGAKAGRIVVPARHNEDVGGGQLEQHSHVFYSDDHGATWKLGGTAGTYSNECQLVELTNGDVMINARNQNLDIRPDNIRRLVAISADGGETWGDTYRDEALISPQVNASIMRYTSCVEHDRNRILFSNPNNHYRTPNHPYGRYNMSVRISYDEGRSWTSGKTIYRYPSSYSSLVILDDMTIGIVYERGPKDSTHYWDELQFARFSLEWLTEGEDSLKS